MFCLAFSSQFPFFFFCLREQQWSHVSSLSLWKKLENVSQLCFVIYLANTRVLNSPFLSFTKEKWTRSKLQIQEEEPSARMCQVQACNPSTLQSSSLGCGHVPVSGQSLETLTQQVPAGGCLIQWQLQLSPCDCTSPNLILRSVPNHTDDRGKYSTYDRVTHDLLTLRVLLSPRRLLQVNPLT